jgi:Zn-dependent metalloprotease
MKRLIASAIFLCVVIFSFAQDGKRSKEFPRFQKEIIRTSRTNAMEAFKKNFEMQADDELKPHKSEKDKLGFTHDKFQQYYKKVKVEGAIYSAHSRNGIIEGYSGEFKGIRNFDVIPAISASSGLQSAIRHVGAKIYAWDISVKDGYPDYKYPTGELVIVGGAAEDNLDLTLAWKYDVYAAEPLYRAEVYINAKTGEFIKENNLIHNTNTSASGTTLYNGPQNFTADQSGTTYRLRQTASGGGVQTYTLKNGTIYFLASDITSTDPNIWSDATAIQAHWGAEQTWSFYFNTFNRNSFNDAGAAIKSYVHYSKNYVNAFWDGSRMTYGDGDLTQGYRPLVSLDICGHEISHGVTTYEANLTYSNESGALNESFSDIFGECIENYAHKSHDWMMSCDIGVSGCGAFRNMMDPNQYGDPDTYKGTNWYSGTSDNGGVHTNSGVQNKWFFILTDGESGTNDNGYIYNVTGIGIDKAAQIAYRNLTVYLTASSNYSVARAGAIQSAIDLYGSASNEVTATTEAWNAVGVYAPAPDTQAPTAPVLSTTSKTQTTIALSWTAATDNVGVIGYDVYVNNIKNNTSNLTSRTYTVSGLTAETIYSIYVVAKDAAGNATNSNTLSVTTIGNTVETLVAGYYFPASLDNWTASSSTNCVWTDNATYAFEGSGCVMIRSASTSATTPTLSLSGYSQVEVKFYFTAAGMESGKTFVLRYSSNNGSSWITVTTFTSASSTSGTRFVTDKGFYVATITMNSTSFNSTAKFRIQTNGSNTTDIIYFDAVTVKGRTNTSGSGNVVTLAAATKGTFSFQGQPGYMKNFESIDPAGDEVVLYPNPVINTLNIKTQAKITAVRIFSSNGSVIKTIQDNSDCSSFDISDLDKGVYIVEIVTEMGSVSKKIIKQ